MNFNFEEVIAKSFKCSRNNIGPRIEPWALHTWPLKDRSFNGFLQLPIRPNSIFPLSVVYGIMGWGLFACMYSCMHVCMHKCMYISVYVCIMHNTYI